MWSRRLFLCSLLALAPGAAHSISLHWASGVDTLTFAEPTRCVLIVRADEGQPLPPEWRLLWLADSSGVNFVAEGEAIACASDTARVSAVSGPVSAPDSAAHLVRIPFCSAGTSAASVAVFLLDQPGGSAGRLKVVALDPGDMTGNRVLASNEVTYNGGVEGDYPPVLLRVTSSHATARLHVTAVGAGLSSVTTAQVGAPDDLWRVPLAITYQEADRLNAAADIPAALPAATVQVGSALGGSDHAAIPADEIPLEQVMSPSPDAIFYRDPDPAIYPKDFAFHYNTVYDPTDPIRPWKGIFHLFYIRSIRATGEDSILAHAWTDSLGKPWNVDLTAFRPSGRGWDKMRVWAPSIQQVGNLTYMFYTGVDSLQNQSIGYATTEMLGTTNILWSRSATPVYRAINTNWASLSTPTHFRDPFVMPDPDVVRYPGRYLFFNTGRDRDFPDSYYAVGVARNRQGTLDVWDNIGKYEATDHNHLPVDAQLESPVVLRDSLTGAWRMFVANGAYDDLGHESTIFLTQNVGDSLTDTRASSWPARDTLYHYTGQDMDVIGWQACEHLQIGQVHFFAAFHGPFGIGITRMHWDTLQRKFVFVRPSIADAPRPRGWAGVEFSMVAARPGASEVRFTIATETPLRAWLHVYDVTGRLVRELADGRVMRGRTEVVWDCRDRGGHAVPTGVYFARLAEGARACVLRVPVIR